jgi:hypothetical protein|tara:strand:- start:2264 stop:4222 length:1959 start_codon:yes stop_codon:yes gene_type:complete
MILYNRPKAFEQPSGQVGTAAQRSDANTIKSKKPQGEIAKQQVMANAGDTVPIVFCKRVNGVGGTWVQPSLVKTATNDSVGTFVYAVGQGEISSSPEKYLAWAGSESVTSKSSSITLNHRHKTAAAMAAAPNVSPLDSGNVFSDINTFSVRQKLFSAGTFTDRMPAWDELYNFRNFITKGSGDTSNSIIRVATIDITVTDQATGDDVTSGFFSAQGLAQNSTTYVDFNVEDFDEFGNTTAGSNPGTIYRSPSSGYRTPDPDYFSDFGATGPISILYENAQIINQVNPNNPASTGTLSGVLVEDHVSTFADPASPPASADYTDFADTTFLEVEGDLYEAPPFGSLPTETKQLCIFYSEGVKVDLYSAGLSDGAYSRGPSNQFVDLALYMFTLIKRADGATTSPLAAPIDVSNLQDIASYCSFNNTFCNGVIDQAVNVIDFVNKLAPFFLLSFVSNNGRYSLQSLLPRDSQNKIDRSALTPAATFTESEILPGSFSKQYEDADQRRAVNINLVWREADPKVIGIQRTSTVRYDTTDNDAPSVQYDMTDVCTSEEHATLYGKYELARRKLSTHTITFDVALTTTGLLPTQIIKVQRQRKNNRGDDRTETEWYQVTNVRHSTDGVSTISAIQFPVNASDASKIAIEVVEGTDFEVL